jgi:hypothetical protein
MLAQLAQGMLAGGAAGAIAGAIMPMPQQGPGNRTMAGFFGGPNAADFLGELGDWTSKLTNPFQLLYDIVVELPGALEEWGMRLKDSQRHLSQYNGVIAAAMIESERRDIVRGFESGSRTGESTAYLTEALSDLEDSVQPLRDISTNIQNRLVGFGTQILANVIQGIQDLKPIHDILSLLQRVTGGEPDARSTPAHEMMKHFLEDAPPAEPSTRPPRFI